MIGQAFCLPGRDCFFVIIRQHPADTSLYLVVPACNCVLAGHLDLSMNTIWGPTIIHCGFSFWINSRDIKNSQPCLNMEQNTQIKEMLGNLIRGKTPPLTNVDYDPEYMDHCEELSHWSDVNPPSSHETGKSIMKTMVYVLLKQERGDDYRWIIGVYKNMEDADEKRSSLIEESWKNYIYHIEEHELS